MCTQTQTALVAKALGQYQVATDVQVAAAEPGKMICKVKAVGLNPSDWKMIDFSATPGSIGGEDFAGEVVEVGQGVTRFKAGDRISACTFGLNPMDKLSGSFCQYAVAYEDLSCKIPDSMSFEDAATFGAAVGTAGYALYKALGFAFPIFNGNSEERTASTEKPPTYVLVSGGATTTGTIAIQLLKASGLTPIATCSTSTRDLVLSMGAVETFDYHSPTCGIEIRNYTKDSLRHVLDCVTQAESMKLSYDAISGKEGGKYVALDPFPTTIQYTRRDIEAEWLMIFSLFGNPVKLSGVYGRPARPLDRQFASVMYPLAERLIAEGRLNPHPVEVRQGGLSAMAEGIEDLRNNKVRGRKLIYPL
ncbi:unnamed protein product [Discula destructiva]